MSAHVLLNLLNMLGKRAFYCFFAMSLINSIIQEQNVRFYLSYDIKITLKSHFWRKMLKFCHYVHNVVMDVIVGSMDDYNRR